MGDPCANGTSGRETLRAENETLADEKAYLAGENEAVLERMADHLAA